VNSRPRRRLLPIQRLPGRWNAVVVALQAAVGLGWLVLAVHYFRDGDRTYGWLWGAVAAMFLLQAWLQARA
jgi:hypothetical protein